MDDDTSWFDAPSTQHHKKSLLSTHKGMLLAGAAAALLALGGAGAVVAHAQATNSLDGPLAAVFGWQQGDATQPGGAPFAGPHDRRGHGPLSVTGVTDSTISAKAPDGTAVTIHTTASTTYGKAGETVSRGAITSGETIAIRGTRNSDGSIAATHVEIVLPAYRGVVTAVSGNTITVRDQLRNQGSQGTATHTITVTSSTTYTQGSQSASLSDVKTGGEIDAEGTLASNGVLTAQVVHIALPRAGGQITKIAGNAITVQGRKGTQIIDVTGSTTYTRESGHTSTSFNALKTGDFIQAEGTKNSDGSLTAVSVHVMQPRTGTAAPHRPAGTGAPSQSGSQQPATTQNGAGI